MTPCILVFGLARSGTTWVGKLFDSHPDVLYRHEPDSVRRLPLPAFPEVDDAPQYQAALQRFVAELPAMRDPEVIGKQPLFAKNYQSHVSLAAYRASVLVAKAASHVHRHFPCAWRPTGASAPATRVVWKSIVSLGRLGVCLRALPDARAIHLLRHPCGCIESVLRGEAQRRFVGTGSAADQHWVLARLLQTTHGQARGLSFDRLKQLTPEERLAWQWVLQQEKALADVAHCDRVLTVRYEDVCANPVDTTHRMFAFTGLDWSPQTEAFVHSSTQNQRADYYSVFKDPQTEAERWRTALPRDTQKRIFAILHTSPLQRFYPDPDHTWERQPVTSGAI